MKEDTTALPQLHADQPASSLDSSVLLKQWCVEQAVRVKNGWYDTHDLLKAAKSIYDFVNS